MTRARGTSRLAAVVMLAVAAAGLTACGEGAEADRPGTPERVLPELEPTFSREQVVWAQGSTIHHGADELRVEGGTVRDLHLSPYGFVAGLETPRDEVGHWAVVDESGTHRLPGEVHSVAVSREGGYLGYTDWDGPLRPAGQVAQAVVVDLSTGEVVARTSEGMGGRLGDDLGALYAEVPPVFLGFSGDVAFFQGSGDTYRWDLPSGEISMLPPAEEGETFARPPWRTGLDYPQPTGFVTADERYLVESSTAGRIAVVDRTGSRPRRVDLAEGHRFAFFGHMLGADRAVLFTLDRYRGGYDPTAPDRTRGHLTVCHLGTGACRDVQDVRGTWSVVFPAGSATSWGEF